MFDITCNFSTTVFHTLHASRHRWLLSRNTIFSDLDLGWGHKVRTKQNLLASFSRKFSEWNEIGNSDEAIQAEHTETTFEGGFFFVFCFCFFFIKKNNCYFTDCIKRVTLARIWTFTNQFGSRMMIDTIRLYICMQVCWTLTLILSSHDTTKQKTSVPVISQMGLGGIWHAVGTCWSNESHTHFTPFDRRSRERIALRWSHLKKKKKGGLRSDIYRLISLTIDMMVDTTKLCRLILVRMTLTFTKG